MLLPTVVKMSSDDNILKEFQKILSKNGIYDKISRVEIDKNPKLPAHFTSICQTIEIIFADSTKSPMHLFEKMIKGNAEIKENTEMSLFERESNIYSHVLPHLVSICQNNQTRCDKKFLVFPRVIEIGVDRIILENLNKQNHKMKEKMIGHNFLEASLVMKSLARFHSTSYLAVKKVGVQKFQSIFPCTQERMMKREGVGAQINTKMMDSVVTKLLALLKDSDLGQAQPIYKRLENYKDGQVFATMCDIIEQESPIIHVMNHGDCWSNNILFELDENGNFAAAKFVDFQMTRIGSPNLDISNYIYNSVQRHVREDTKMVLNLLEIYLSELKSCVRQLHPEDKEIQEIKFEDFLRDHVRIGKLGFLYGIYVAAADPIIGKIDLDHSENWLDHFVNSICSYLDSNEEDRDLVLQNVIGMTNTYFKLKQMSEKCEIIEDVEASEE